MAHVAHAQPGVGFNFDGFKNNLKSYGKTIFLMLVESRLETAKKQVKALSPELRAQVNKNWRR